MKFTLKNVGKIKNAEIELQGISVVAGENNTGKSTIGKMLFSVFDSFYKINEQTDNERRQNITRLIYGFYREQSDWISRTIDRPDFSQRCIKERGYFIADPKRLENELRKFYMQLDSAFARKLSDEDIEKLASRVYASLRIEDAEIRSVLLKKRLRAEFGMKIGHLNAQDELSEICLEVKRSKIEFTVRRNSDIEIKNYMNLVKEISYIDDPFVLDELNADWAAIWALSDEYDHRNNLLKKLIGNNKESAVDAIEEVLVQRKLNSIFDSMSSVCDGDIFSSEKGRSYVYRTQGLKGDLEIANLSTGIKSFVILRTLLKNGSIDDNGIIVMDEPEIHLHPEWQLRFAEIIVLIQKEFDTNILLNTHSPYFLNAIQVYSKKYGIADKCKYYMTKENDGKVELLDVTNHTESIYAKLAAPLQELENLEYC